MISQCKDTGEHLGADIWKQGGSHHQKDPACLGEITGYAFRSGEQGQMEPIWSDWELQMRDFPPFQCPFSPAFSGFSLQLLSEDIPGPSKQILWASGLQDSSRGHEMSRLEETEKAQE